MLRGLSHKRACPKHAEGPVPRAGMSQACGRACPKSGLVPSMWKGLSQERACPKHVEGPVPRAGMSQACGRACPKSGHVPSMFKGLSQERACPCTHPRPHAHAHVHSTDTSTHINHDNNSPDAFSVLAMTYNVVVVSIHCKILSDTRVSPTRENRRACRH